jgi:hypothetical protein
VGIYYTIFIYIFLNFLFTFSKIYVIISKIRNYYRNNYQKMEGFFVESSKINVLLEEIASEIEAAEKQNLSLYNAAIDIEDESLSLKTQAESFKALRKMKGLKIAFDTFRKELEKSGLSKSYVFISNEHGSVAVDGLSHSDDEYDEYEIEEYEYEDASDYEDEIVEDYEEEDIEHIEYAAESDIEDIEIEEEVIENDYLPDYIADEIETMGDIVEELSGLSSEENEDDEIHEEIEVDSLDEEFGIDVEPTGPLFTVPEDLTIDEPEPEPSSAVTEEIEIEFDEDEPIVETVEEALAELTGLVKEEAVPVPTMKEFDNTQPQIEDLFSDLVLDLPSSSGEEVHKPVEAVAPVTPVAPVKPTGTPAEEITPFVANVPAAAPAVPALQEFEPVAPVIQEFRPEPAPAVPVAPDVPAVQEFKPDPVPELSVSDFAPVKPLQPVEPEPVKAAPPVQLEQIKPQAMTPPPTPIFEPVADITPEPVPAVPEFRPEPVPEVPEFQELKPEPVPAVSEVKKEDDFSGFGMTPQSHTGIYSNRNPAGFTMFGRRVDVVGWSDMLVRVCEILILKNPYTVAQFDKYSDLNPMGNCYFSYNQGEITGNAKKLSNGLWVEMNRTPDDIVMLCKKVLELCGYPRSELEIEFID